MIVFNGDLADRGGHGVEVIAIVCALVLAYPNQVFINRGNHEDLALSVTYGLALEIQHKYGPATFTKQLGPLLDDFFRSLPVATVIEKDALIVHGGPPPPGVTLANVSQLERTSAKQFSRTVRTTKTSQGDEIHAEKEHDLILESLLWSDPSIDEVTGNLKDNRNGKPWKPNKSRGAGFKYDSNIVRDVLQQERLFRMIRSHEPVHNGCVRYAINDYEKTPGPHREFFTVFSASRYPNKEGFNRGAILTLLPLKGHRIVRYDTEDDEPVMELSKVLAPDPTILDQVPFIDQEVNPCNINSIALRRSLSEAIASHRSQLEFCLEQRANSLRVDIQQLPFCEAVDVLVDVLQLDGEGLCQPGPRLALARALSKQCNTETPPESIDLIHALDDCIAEQDGSNYLIHLTWLHTIFSLVDANHDGVVSYGEWKAAVTKINQSLPPDATVDADETWEVLDLDHDGYVTAGEWDSVLLDVSLTRGQK